MSQCSPLPNTHLLLYRCKRPGADILQAAPAEVHAGFWHGVGRAVRGGRGQALQQPHPEPAGALPLSNEGHSAAGSIDMCGAKCWDGVDVVGGQHEAYVVSPMI